MTRRPLHLLTVPLAALIWLAAFAPLAAQDASCDSAEHRQFDFWIGDWQVKAPDGSELGTNRITSILDGCVLHESWKGADGSVGQSFNMYYQRDGRWYQNWVDRAGNRLDMTGGLRDGVMVMEGQTPAPNGREQLHRITWRPLEDGTVEQRWESSSDAGASWTDSFLGIYSKAGRAGEDGEDDG